MRKKKIKREEKSRVAYERERESACVMNTKYKRNLLAEAVVRVTGGLTFEAGDLNTSRSDSRVVQRISLEC